MKITTESQSGNSPPTGGCTVDLRSARLTCFSSWWLVTEHQTFLDTRDWNSWGWGFKISLSWFLGIWASQFLVPGDPRGVYTPLLPGRHLCILPHSFCSPFVLLTLSFCNINCYCYFDSSKHVSELEELTRKLINFFKKNFSVFHGCLPDGASRSRGHGNMRQKVFGKWLSSVNGVRKEIKWRCGSFCKCVISNDRRVWQMHVISSLHSAMLRQCWKSVDYIKWVTDWGAQLGWCVGPHN